MRNKIRNWWQDHRLPTLEIFWSRTGPANYRFFEFHRWSNLKNTWHGDDIYIGHLAIWVGWPVRRKP